MVVYHAVNHEVQMILWNDFSIVLTNLTAIVSSLRAPSNSYLENKSVSFAIDKKTCHID